MEVDRGRYQLYGREIHDISSFAICLVKCSKCGFQGWATTCDMLKEEPTVLENLVRFGPVIFRNHEVYCLTCDRKE